ncbi:MAG TPA: SpoIIE family protein phosphatase [Thermoanaerobaculia bacterium]|nr:SpoIIE family protein phosphatase [Thermoanaerobaculia bacterium]
MTREGTASLAPRIREILSAIGEDPGDEETLAARIEEAAASSPDAAPGAAWITARLLGRALKEARFELKERVLELESLYDLGLSLGGQLDLDRLADEILLRSISLTNSRSGALHLFDGDRPILSRAFGGALLAPEDAVRIDLGAEGAINNSAVTSPTCGVWLSECEKCLVVPIQSETRRLGVLAVADKETRDGTIRDFFPGDARLLALFASQAATAIETARLHREALEKERLDRELELAAAIQREILPREVPTFPGLAIAAENRSTRQVGGDYFDFFPLAGERFAFVVADVSGKGVPAALLVSTLASAIHLQIEDAKTPVELVDRVHRHLTRFSRARKFATLFLGVFHTRTGELQYVSAGHNPALLVRADGAVEWLPATGRPVGMLPDSTWTEARAFVRAGDRLCVYTDGITEAQNPVQDEFGTERLAAYLSRVAGLPVRDAASALFGEVLLFADAAPQYDDQTLLLLARGETGT